MIRVRVACHENDGNQENDENDKGKSDSYKQGSWVLDSRKSRKPRKLRKPPESRVQTTGLEIPEEVHTKVHKSAHELSQRKQTFSVPNGPHSPHEH